MTTGKKITQEEMIDMFGTDMPLEAMTLLANSDDSKTIGQMRDELRAMGNRRKASRNILGIMSAPMPDEDRCLTPYDQGMACAGRIYDAVMPEIAQRVRNEIADLLDVRAEQAEPQGRVGQQVGTYFAALAMHLRGEKNA